MASAVMPLRATYQPDVTERLIRIAIECVAWGVDRECFLESSCVARQLPSLMCGHVTSGPRGRTAAQPWLGIGDRPRAM